MASTKEEEQEQFELFTTLRHDPLLASNPTNRSLCSSEAGRCFYMLSLHRLRIAEAAKRFGWADVVRVVEADGGREFEGRLRDAVGEWAESQGKGGAEGALRVKVLLSHFGALRIECSPTPPLPLSSLYPTSLSPPPPPQPSQPQPSKPFRPSPLTGGALTLGPDDTLPSQSHPQPPAPWRILLDTQATPTSAFTTYKTTKREMYDSARVRVGITDFNEAREVLLWNERGEVMEGSLTSVYFLRGRSSSTSSSAGGSEERDGGQGQGKHEEEMVWVTPWVGEGEAGSGGQRGTTRRWAVERGLCVEGTMRKESVRVGEGVWVSNGVRGFIWGVVDRV